jgi:hypothetical protein
VIMKFEDVLMMLTCVVEVPRERALVKSAHIIPLKIRFSPKNICSNQLVPSNNEEPCRNLTRVHMRGGR